MPDEYGSYLLCGYLGDLFSDQPDVTTAKVINVDPPAPPAPPAPPDTTGPAVKVAWPSSVRASKTGRFRLPVSCPQSEQVCTGNISLRSASRVRASRAKRRFVKFGTKAFAANSGQTAEPQFVCRVQRESCQTPEGRSREGHGRRAGPDRKCGDKDSDVDTPSPALDPVHAAKRRSARGVAGDGEGARADGGSLARPQRCGGFAHSRLRWAAGRLRWAAHYQGRRGYREDSTSVGGRCGFGGAGFRSRPSECGHDDRHDARLGRGRRNRGLVWRAQHGHLRSGRDSAGRGDSTDKLHVLHEAPD